MKIKEDTGHTIDMHGLTLKGAMEELESLVHLYGEDTIIEKVEDYYDDRNYSLYLFTHREETKEEETIRLKLLVAKESIREAKRRSDYKRLKKEFGG